MKSTVGMHPKFSIIKLLT